MIYLSLSLSLSLALSLSVCLPHLDTLNAHDARAQQVEVVVEVELADHHLTLRSSAMAKSGRPWER